MSKLRIATRKSKLALWQAEHVATQLQQHYPELEVELVPITTTGDKVQHKRLADIGGKALFIKELEHALLEQTADIAVHSMKDVPPQMPSGLTIAAMLQRADARDAFVSEQYANWQQLPKGAVVGTCSPRRTAQLLHLRPDLTMKDLRGNVDSRLAKLQRGDYDAIILAAAGLTRLGLQAMITDYFPLDVLVPSVAQGAIGIECRSEDNATIDLVSVLNDTNTAVCVNAERDLVRALNGDCHSPIGSYAHIENNKLHLRGLIAALDGSVVVTAKDSFALPQVESAGEKISQQLLAQIDQPCW